MKTMQKCVVEEEVKNLLVAYFQQEWQKVLSLQEGKKEEIIQLQEVMEELNKKRAEILARHFCDGSLVTWTGGKEDIEQYYSLFFSKVFPECIPAVVQYMSGRVAELELLIEEAEGTPSDYYRRLIEAAIDIANRRHIQLTAVVSSAEWRIELARRLYSNRKEFMDRKQRLIKSLLSPQTILLILKLIVDINFTGALNAIGKEWQLDLDEDIIELYSSVEAVAEDLSETIEDKITRMSSIMMESLETNARAIWD